ncbi:MAG: M20/M25/M40 family metallo-hydrolase, partial [Candidatus Bathyarchaeota archaeon]|nr:M20/M25/M40 family metallo-hydrolase [Candidatus Bathyarchaeota archaeon]
MTTLRDPFTLRALKNLNQDELVDLCSRLIQIPSDNPPGDTKVTAEYIKNYLSDAGIESTLCETKPGIVSLMSTIGKGSPHLILNGHLDQFPAEVGEKWSFNPYSGEVKDGKILGRGSGDMKGGLSSLIYCFKKAANLNLPGMITLTCTADEETGGKWGALWLLTNYPELHGDGVLNGEPSGLTVRIGEKGAMPLNITTTGKAAHGSFSGYAGSNAISKMARIIPIVESFHAYAPRFKTNSQRILKLVDAGYTAQFGHEGEGLSRVLKEVTVNTGVIKGGVKSNIVPAHCEAEVDIRLPLDTNP